MWCHVLYGFFLDYLQMIFSASALLLQVSVPHGIRTDVCPGLTIWITPPHKHISRHELSSAGMPPISAVCALGSQGASVADRKVSASARPLPQRWR
jgi:hypothetical protein